MDTPVLCPRCRTPLVGRAANPAAYDCGTCRGLFLCGSEVDEARLQEAVVVDPTAAASEADRANSAAATRDALQAVPAVCPGCGRLMQFLRLGEAVLDRCPACGGVWLDAGEELTAERPSEAPAALSRYLLYSMSLPERVIRSTVGVAAGALQETAGFLVPQAFQSSKSYEIIIRNSLRFLVEDIGGVAAEGAAPSGPDDYLARKAVGNFIDLAGLATLHTSPLWIMAIVSDLAYGSQAYVLELARELQDKGLIDETSTIHHVDDLLDAVRNASGSVASTLDTPPLSVDEMKKTLDQTRAAMSSADYRRILPESELNALWKEMRDIASREDVGLIGISAAVTMQTLGKVKTVSHGALTGVQVVGGLLNRHVVDHYRTSLRSVREKGFYRVVQESATPYIEGVWNNFSESRDSWTEQVLTGRAFSAAYQAVRGWWSRPAGDLAAQVPEVPTQTPNASEPHDTA